MPLTAAATSTTGRAATRGASVDRYLCAWTWVEPVFGRYVYAELLHPGLCAIAPGYGVDYVALARHAKAAHRHRGLVMLLAASIPVLVLVVALIVLVTGLGGGWVAATLLSLLPAGLAAFVVLIGWHLYVSRARASRILFGLAAPRDTAPALDAAVEERLSDRAAANVIPFGGGIPFVGAGRRLDRWKVRVDTTKAATDKNGAKRPLLPVSAEELQKELSTTVRGAGIPDLEVHNRLFVAGRYTDRVPGLLPDPQAAPNPRIERREIRLAIEGATETARTYLCIGKNSWAGELVVTLFMRAVTFGTDLFVEFHAYVLLPLHPEVKQTGELPVTVPGRLVSVARAAVPTAVRLVRAAPREALSLLRWRWQLVRRLDRQRRHVRKMAHFNYGAFGGIRSIVAAKQREWLFAYEDEDMYVQALRTRILKVIVKYVGGHGIDTSDLERQQTKIISKTYKIGDIKGRNIVLGDHTIFHDLAGGAPTEIEEDDDDDDDDDRDPKKRSR